MQEAGVGRTSATWLGWRDSNPRYQSQSLVCYHYATSQYRGKNHRGSGSLPIPDFVGWVKGFEPSTPGTTIRCSNQLSYTHHISGITREASPQAALGEMVRQKGFEPPAYCLEGSCSIRLSYWRISIPTNPFEENGAGDGNRTHVISLEG